LLKVNPRSPEQPPSSAGCIERTWRKSAFDRGSGTGFWETYEKAKGGEMNTKQTVRFCGALITAIMGLVWIAGMACAAEDGKININTASVDELEMLQGVGPVYAAKIVEYRQQNGPFQAPDELMKVKGIGPKTFEANRELIIIE
jgi:competence protein ComEA